MSFNANSYESRQLVYNLKIQKSKLKILTENITIVTEM